MKLNVATANLPLQDAFVKAAASMAKRIQTVPYGAKLQPPTARQSAQKAKK